MNKQNFSRELRLLTPEQFKIVFHHPQKASSPEFTILACPNNLDFPRLGLAIPKKQLKFAHQRNRIKRLCRESFRLNQQQLAGLDFVILARKVSDERSNHQLFVTLSKLWQRHIRLAQKS